MGEESERNSKWDLAKVYWTEHWTIRVNSMMYNIADSQPDVTEPGVPISIGGSITTTKPLCQTSAFF